MSSDKLEVQLEPEKTMILSVPVIDILETEASNFDKKLVINITDELLYQSIDGNWEKLGPYTGKFVKK